MAQSITTPVPAPAPALMSTTPTTAFLTGTGTITIIPALATHIPIIQTLSVAAFTKYIPLIGRRPAPMDVDYHALLSTPETAVYVLALTTGTDTAPEGDIQVLGAITLTTPPLSSFLHVNNLLVDPESQGRGYGRLLLEFAESKAREAGREAVTLATHVQMVNNIRFYLNVGFKETGRETVDGFDRVNFRKELGSS
ncbi:acyl-CoA N-acyltransferase [Aspergillus oleicola]